MEQNFDFQFTSEEDIQHLLDGFVEGMQDMVAEEKPNTKQKKQVFSFRATLDNIADWKAYATATGQTMENVGTAAMNEYLDRHKLTGAEQAIFEAMKAKSEK